QMLAEQHEGRDRLRRDRDELILVANEVAQLDLGLSAAGDRAGLEVDFADLLPADWQIVKAIASIAAADDYFAVELQVALPRRFAVGQVNGLHPIAAEQDDFAFVNAGDQKHVIAANGRPASLAAEQVEAMELLRFGGRENDAAFGDGGGSVEPSGAWIGRHVG